MAKKNKKELSKKGIAMNIFNRLEAVLSRYIPVTGKKKFANYLKKTAKLFANDIADAAKKEQEKIKKKAKKTAKKSEKKTVKKDTKKKDKKAVKKNPVKKTIEKRIDKTAPELPAPSDTEKPVESILN